MNINFYNISDNTVFHRYSFFIFFIINFYELIVKPAHHWSHLLLIYISPIFSCVCPSWYNPSFLPLSFILRTVLPHQDSTMLSKPRGSQPNIQALSKKLQKELSSSGWRQPQRSSFLRRPASGLNVCFRAPSQLLHGKNWPALTQLPWFCTDPQGRLYNDSISYFLNKANKIF